MRACFNMLYTDTTTKDSKTITYDRARNCRLQLTAAKAQLSLLN